MRIEWPDSSLAMELSKPARSVARLMILCLVTPADIFPCLAWVPQEEINLGGPEIGRIRPDQHLPCSLVLAYLFDAFAEPDDFPAGLRESELHEFPDGMALTCGEHIIAGLGLLEHHPHAFGIVAGVPPIALGLEIAKVEAVLQPVFDMGDGPGNLPGYESLASDRAFMIEKDAV